MRATRASMDWVDSLLGRQARWHVWRRWRGWRASKCGGLAFISWVGQVVCLCGWHANDGGISDVLTRMACYYYCYWCYWNAILKSKMLNVYFWSKNEKIFQIDLNSDLKEEPDFKSGCWFTLFEFEPVM